MRKQHASLIGLSFLVCLGAGSFVWGRWQPSPENIEQPVQKIQDQDQDQDAGLGENSFAVGLQELAGQANHLAGFATPEYDDCLVKIENMPTDGLTMAETWKEQGGGTAALHCAAFAHARLGNHTQAAELFDLVGSRLTPVEPALAATSFVAAGIHWGEQAKLRVGENDQFAATQTLERAIRAMEQAQVIDPDDPDHFVDFAILLAEFSYPQEALALLEGALEIRQNHPPALWFQAQIYLDLGQQEQAIKTLEILSLADPNGFYGRAAENVLTSFGLTPDQ